MSFTFPFVDLAETSATQEYLSRRSIRTHPATIRLHLLAPGSIEISTYKKNQRLETVKEQLTVCEQATWPQLRAELQALIQIPFVEEGGTGQKGKGKIRAVVEFKMEGTWLVVHALNWVTVRKYFTEELPYSIGSSSHGVMDVWFEIEEPRARAQCRRRSVKTEDEVSMDGELAERGTPPPTYRHATQMNEAEAVVWVAWLWNAVSWIWGGKRGSPFAV
jgi:hypothetical protein